MSHKQYILDNIRSYQIALKEDLSLYERCYEKLSNLTDDEITDFCCVDKDKYTDYFGDCIDLALHVSRAVKGDKVDDLWVNYED
jgi:hypothetical protein